MLCCVSKALTAALGAGRSKEPWWALPSTNWEARSEWTNLMIWAANNCAFPAQHCDHWWAPRQAAARPELRWECLREGTATLQCHGAQAWTLAQEHDLRQNLLDNFWVLLTWAGETFLNPSFNPSLFWSFVLILLQLLFFQINSYFCWVPRAKD